MPRLRYAATARADLSEIAEYIAKENPQAAGRVIASIRRTCRSIAERPGIGRNRPDIAPGFYSFPVGSYVVFYRVCSETVEVLSVLHGARDIERVFSEQKAGITG